MRKSIVGLAVALFGLLLFVALGSAAPQDNRVSPTAIPWAYNTNAGPGPGNAAPGNAPPRAAAPPAQPAAADTSPQHVPESTLTFTLEQTHDRYAVADWFPGDHGSPMPSFVSQGNKQAMAYACAYCHLPNGRGRPENAPVAGLPVEYFVKQVMDFRNGARRSADPRKGNIALMVNAVKAMTDQDIQAAAEYYASIPFAPWSIVKEADTVPKARLAAGLYAKLAGDATEPTGDRIVEMTEHVKETEDLRDDHIGFTAYAPVGSVERGEMLVKTGGGGKTVACGTCHGATLKGIGPIPPIAGRQASYIARQLYDFQHNARHGSWSPLMSGAVAQLAPDDILDIAAYVAAQKP